MANIVYNMCRFLFLEPISASAEQASEQYLRSAQAESDIYPPEPSMLARQAQKFGRKKFS